jgi:hypothetical protein
MGDRWGVDYKESEEISDDLQKHLHMLRWGCESFPENEEDEAEAQP